MKKMQKLVFGSTIAALTFGSLALMTGLNAAPRPVRSSKRIVIDCAPGWRAGAGGSYGGVPFDVSCSNGKGHLFIDGMVGTAYSIRMGVENAQIGGDCAWSGDSPTVDQTCIAVRLTIR